MSPLKKQFSSSGCHAQVGLGCNFCYQKCLKLTGLAVQSLGELVDCRGNLQTLVEDGALPLQANVTRPFHKACQITLGLNILAWGERQKINI